VLLAEMRGRIALARARTPRPADVEQRHAFGLRLLQAVPERAPRAHVLRLLLGPHDLAHVRIAAHELGGLLDPERIWPLDPGHGDAPPRIAVLVADDVVVDLPLTEHEPRHLLALDARIVEHRPELAGREILESRGSLLQPQKALRGHYDERAGRRVE